MGPWTHPRVWLFFLSRPSMPMMTMRVPACAARALTARACAFALEGESHVCSGLSVSEISGDELHVLHRQTGQNLSNAYALGPRCRHGYPQAFMWDPMPVERKAVPIDAGLFRLSCPLLVKAIDEWESEGAVATLNAEVEADQSGALRSQLTQANAGHAAARKEVLGSRLHALLSTASTSPQDLRLARMVADSGIAGQSRGKPEVKCLHAQVADHLCRSRSNAVGQRVLEGLQARGVLVDGDETCRGQCDPAVPPKEAPWWYTPTKNKWKLHKRVEARRERRAARDRAG